MNDDMTDLKHTTGALPLDLVRDLPPTIVVALMAQAAVTAPQVSDLLAQLDANPEARIALGITIDELKVARQILSTVQPVTSSAPSVYADIPLGVPARPTLKPLSDEAIADGEDHS